ncbi:MAG TPA: DUF2017 family protein [Acidimicrobiales bacterium]
MGDYGARHLSPLLPRRPIRRDRQGGYHLNLSDDDRGVLRQLAPQFRDLLDDPGQPVLQRLFPPAYSDAAHAEQQDEYRRLMQEDLVTRHRDELDLLGSTAAATHLSEEQLLGWTRALNSLRLVLGTFLDVSEDEERRPETVEESLYHWLSYLLGEAIEELSGTT